MIKAKINSTGEVVNVRPHQTEIYDFMVCRNGGIMGELYMRSELTIFDAVAFLDDHPKLKEKYSPYVCSVCGQWHIGHLHKRKKK